MISQRLGLCFAVGLVAIAGRQLDAAEVVVGSSRLPQHFITLLLPLPADEKNPPGVVHHEHDGKLTVDFFTGRRLQVKLANREGGGFSVVDESAAGGRREYSIYAP